MADVPGWMTFLSEAAKGFERSQNARLEAEYKEQYDAGYEAARSGEEPRMRLMAEDPRFYRAYMAGYRAGSD